MATIKINDADGKEYTLSFNLKTVRQMSDNGFNIQQVSENPITLIPRLFAGAFLRYHRTIPQSKIDEIWEQIEDKEGFITALVELYNDPVDKLFGEPEETAKKAKWEIVK